MRRYALVIAAVLQAMAAHAGGTRSWELSTYGDFLGGTFTKVALDRDGILEVAPSLEALHESDQAVVWSIARDKDGTVYYGTGHQGGVFRVRPGEEGALLWKAPEIEVFALAVGPGGDLYAGTSPGGKVYRISAEGESTEFFDPGEKYIWSLVFDPQGRLIVGTGDAGKIYRVTPDGQGEPWFDSGQRHVISLAVDGDGAVLAGTDPEGILYRLKDDGAAFALHDSDLPEIRSVIVTADGTIYFAAMGGGMDRLLQTIPAQQVAAQAQVASGAQATVQVSAPQASSTVTYSQPQVVYSGERSTLMRLVDGKAVERIWSSNEENILGLTARARELPGVLFATDREGRVYRTGPNRQISLVSQTGKAQMTSMLLDSDGILIGAAHGGSLFRLSPEPADEGVFKTAPHNTNGVSQWGRLSWVGEAPSGSTIEIRTRSGNTYRPDKSWSGWSEALPASDGSQILSPPARFLQWQATLRGAARLDSVRVHYLPQNAAPVVRSVNVVPEVPKATASAGSSSSNTASSYSITVSASGTSSAPQPAGSKAQASAPSRKLAIVWSAEDPDGDELRAELSFRGAGETSWKKIRDDLPGPRFSIESDALADGLYEFRVRVDDGKTNPEGRALSGERVSRPVLVDHTPPRLEALPDAPPGELRFAAEDAASEIRTAEYAVDAGKWHPILSDDGILDAPREEFTVRPGVLDPGEHLVVLRVRDRAGNTALAKSLVR